MEAFAPEDDPSEPLACVPGEDRPLRARTLLGCLFGSLILTGGILGLIWPEAFTADELPPLHDACTGLIWYGLLLLLLILPLRRVSIPLRSLFTAGRHRYLVGWAVRLALPLVCLSIGCVYLLYLPLSLVAPSFVEAWLLEGGSVFWTSGEHHGLANLVSALVIVLLAPFTEEIFFRRLLLVAWESKWGGKASAIASSVLFAIFHQDIIGSFLFSIVLSVVFLRTRTLLLPLLSHAANNAIGFALAAAEEGLLSRQGRSPSLSEFQSEWWLGALGLAIGAPWLLWEIRRFLARVDDRDQATAVCETRTRG